MLLMFRTDAGFRVVLPCNCGKALPVMSSEVFVNRIELRFIFLPRFFQVCECSLQNLSTRSLLLKIRAGRIGYAKNANKPWERKTLTDQGHQTYTERKKDDQIAMRKRATIRQRLRQCDGCRQRDYPAHTSPSQDHYAPRRWRLRVLVKHAGADQSRNECAGKNPDRSEERRV